MLYYLPLESYKARYTMQWSAPVTGWLERNWLGAGIPYKRIDPNNGAEQARDIKVGCVVDGVGRSLYSFQQFAEVLRLAESGAITSSDVIYIDDFWAPGFESLPYAFHLLGIKPKMYAFLHAQSVDEFDFTHPMRTWMRPFEVGNAEVLNGIFVCGHTLKDLVVRGGIAPAYKVRVTGHPFNSTEVMERMPQWHRGFMSGIGERSVPPRQNKVVYSSRFDKEKNPHFFMNVADRLIKEHKDVVVVVCTGSTQLKSNDPTAVPRARHMMATYPGRFVIKEGITKEEYYAELCSAKVQLNTADQDFVAITLLEASVAGCYPVYPYFRSFPETLRYSHEYMYQRLDEWHATSSILRVLDRNDLWTREEINKRAWIHERFDTSWRRMLWHMNLTDVVPGSLNPYAC